MKNTPTTLEQLKKYNIHLDKQSISLFSLLNTVQLETRNIFLNPKTSLEQKENLLENLTFSYTKKTSQLRDTLPEYFNAFVQSIEIINNHSNSYSFYRDLIAHSESGLQKKTVKPILQKKYGGFLTLWLVYLSTLKTTFNENFAILLLKALIKPIYNNA